MDTIKMICQAKRILPPVAPPHHKGQELLSCWPAKLMIGGNKDPSQLVTLSSDVDKYSVKWLQQG